MDADSYDNGTPSWVELTTPDPHASAEFYRQLFGWHTTPGLGGQPDSQTCLLRTRPVAAITRGPNDERAAWITYVNSADADKAATAVQAAGGRVLITPHPVGEAGRAGLFADHSGTVFGTWEPDQHPGAGIVGEPGTFHGGELITDNVQASAAFYGSVFGWTLAEPHGPLGRRDWLLGDRAVSVLLPRPPAMPKDIPPYWDVHFTAADATSTAQAGVELGATLLMPATPIEHGTIAVLADPTGAVFTVIAPHH